MIKINELLDEARNSISSFCIEECKALCCKRGKLILFSESEANSIKNKLEVDKLYKLIMREDGIYFFDLETDFCPNLDKACMCTIHKNKDRPRVCGDYPIFLKGDNIFISGNCPAVMNNLLEKYSKLFKQAGFIVLYK